MGIGDRRRYALRCAASMACLTAVSEARGQAEIFEIFGGVSNINFGHDLASIGDLDLDGVPDFIVGIPNDDVTALDAGAVEVLSGANRSLLWRVLGSSTLGYFGRSVAGPGDLDCDGFVDFVVAAPYVDSNGTDAGAITAYSGLNARTLWVANGSGSFQYLGYSMVAIGDFNGDGVNDLAAGAPWRDSTGKTDHGAVEVRSGRDGALLTTFTGTTAFGLFGIAVDECADVNADGVMDFIIGEQALNRAHLVSGADGSILRTINAPNGGTFGAVVANVGDWSLDGLDDVAIGSPAEGNGYARIYDSSNGLLVTTVVGKSGGSRLGAAMRCRDFSADGSPDLLVSAPFDSRIPGTFGSVELVSGRTFRRLYTWQAKANDDDFGFALATSDDMNGDDAPDFLASSPLHDRPALNNNGAVRAYTTGRLYLEILPRSFTPGNTIALQVGEGKLGDLWMIAVTE
ncbi:MAG: FG-GAP repeat protein, partial [Planctomycetes bacterium]|nr:FG-GAP repeat protein [Planctomycetota bacterium]